MIAIAVATVETVLECTHHLGCSVLVIARAKAQALAALNSPHIAAIHDVIDFDGRQAIIMELVLGTTLLDVIARGPVPVRLAIGYAIDISEALRVAHGASIVHRDLKPANVVVTESGFAKVLDFGIAKLGVDEATATDRGTMTAVTQDHAVLGTIGYMSPEQAEGQPLDGRSDIFCLEHFQPASLAGCGGSGGRTRSPFGWRH
jgi:eukaryotic-like serine/threonine-protein kinase